MSMSTRLLEINGDASRLAIMQRFWRLCERLPHAALLWDTTPLPRVRQTSKGLLSLQMSET